MRWNGGIVQYYCLTAINAQKVACYNAVIMLVKELIGRLNSFNMDAEVHLVAINEQGEPVDGEVDFTIDDGQFVDNGNTENLTIAIVPAPLEPVDSIAEPESE